MNFIKQLQADKAESDAKLAQAQASVTAFLAYLSGPKFTGMDNGERKDWIATGDVQTWLLQFRMELQ